MNQLINNLDLIETFVPEMKTLFIKRYNLLKLVEVYGPIGRRSLSIRSQFSERQVRNHSDFLKEEGLVDYHSEGIVVTEKGIEMLELLEELSYHYSGISHLRNLIVKKLGIKDVLIVDAPENDLEASLKSMGKVAAKYLFSILEENDILGLTGGTSVRGMVESIDKASCKDQNTIVVPARGGLGNSTRYQANTLAEVLAIKVGGEYGPLYMPDSLSEASIKTLMEEPKIKETIRLIRKIDCLVFGIGKADVMAKRRSLDKATYQGIVEAGAVSEAFGYYFNDEGEIVYEISTLGIEIEQFKSLERLIAIAGGVDKARSIVSISKINKNLVLVTDTNCAREIIDILRRKS
jgi:central glycolytic genes regulator